MASFKKILYSLTIMTWLQVFLEAKKHTVGDLDGWTATNIDYKVWASSKTFHPGDTLVFEYDAMLHNVIQVQADDYESCNPTAAAIATYKTGKDKITLKAKGNYYFFCGSPGHCEAGQKVEIKVVNPSSSASSPSLTSSPTNSSTKSPPSPLVSSSPKSSTSPPRSSGTSGVVPSKGLLMTTLFVVLPLLLDLVYHPRWF